MESDIKILYRHVDYLCNSFTPHRHFGNIDALNQIADWIHNEFNEYGLQVSEQEWKVGKQHYRNVIGSLYPNAKKRLVVGAHYDVYANNPGADDNASGMAGLMEMARLASASLPSLEYGIDFVAYCLEEPPFFGTPDMGSYVHAKECALQKEDIIGMVCLDMIGYFSDEPMSQRFPNDQMAQLFPSTANFILVVGCEEFEPFSRFFFEKMNAANEMNVETIHFPDADSLGGLSDHRNYWHFGMNALMINNSAFLRNPNYHEKTDTIETLYFEKMKQVVDATLSACLSFNSF